MTAQPMQEMLLEGIREAPADAAGLLVLADWFEEQGDPRAELLRLDVELRKTQPFWQSDPRRREHERRVQELLVAGTRPCVPLLSNSIGMTFALIPPGTFVMGSPAHEIGFLAEEGPQHEAQITKPFYLGIYPVTQAQYRAVMGDNPSRYLERDDQPVERVSWYDAVAFCERLSARRAEKAARRTYRLPTEAEWEHACRAGTTTAFNYGEGPDHSRANFGEDYYPFEHSTDSGVPNRRGTSPVGAYAPNLWGLFDMHGNVWEWCADYFGEDYYQASPRRDPLNAERSPVRSIRGGAWFGPTRTAVRQGWADGFRYHDLGFRVACAAG